MTVPYARKCLPFTSRSAVRNTTKNGDGANNRATLTSSGMVMLLRTVTPLSDGKDTPESAVTFSAAMTVN